MRKDFPLEIHGLTVSIERQFSNNPSPAWSFYLPINTSGEKHPAARILTERLEKIHYAIMRCVSRSLGRSDNSLPLLVTEISPEKEDAIRKLHRLCDWVITLDRNVGIKYLDSTKEKNLNAIYESYIF